MRSTGVQKMGTWWFRQWGIWVYIYDHFMLKDSWLKGLAKVYGFQKWSGKIIFFAIICPMVFGTCSCLFISEAFYP
jgi:hypothetical protein